MFPLSFIFGFSMLVFGFLYTLLEVYLSGVLVYIIWGVLALSAISVFTLFKRKNKVYTLALLGVILISVLYLCRLSFSYSACMNLAEKYSGVQSPNVECVVLSKSRVKNEKSEMFTVDVLVRSVEGEKLPLRKPKMRLSVKQVPFSVGDVLVVNTKLKPSILKSKGIMWEGRVYSEILVVNQVKFIHLLGAVRNKIHDAIFDYLPYDYAAVSLGMLTGEKDALPKDISTSFKMAGIIHLFSVSGFHVGLFGMLVNKGLLGIGFNKKGTSLLSIFFVLFYLFLTGASVSTMRASLMLIIFFVGRIFRMDSDALSSLGIAAAFILLLDPFTAGDMGFLLSFFATLGIIVIKPMLSKRIPEVISVSLSALAFTTPIMCIFGGDISLLAPLGNLLCGGVASASIIFCFVGYIASIFPFTTFISYPAFLVTGLCDKFVIFVSSTLEKVPYMYMTGESNSLVFTTASALLFCALVLLISHDSKKGGRMALFVPLCMYFVSFIFLIFS